METGRVRLDSWKEISAGLGVSERTARRYELLEGLPVHRHMHEQRGSVYAWSDELESWRQGRTTCLDAVPKQGTTDESLLVASPHVPLIGREDERDLVLRAVDAACSGRGSILLIEGEPGIGKTHLVEAVMADASRRGCLAAIGQCRDMEGAAPYLPFIEIVECSARGLPRDVFRKALGNSAAELGRLVPGLRSFAHIRASLDPSPEPSRHMLFNACRDFIARCARLRPVVAVFEDVHWADEGTLILLSYLLRTVPDVPLLLVVTYRSLDLDSSGPFTRFLEGCVRDKEVRRLRLRPLALSAVGALLDHLRGQPTPEQVVRLCLDKTEGNPFFIRELFLHLRAEGKALDEPGAWRNIFHDESAQVPDVVRLVVLRRLERVQEQTIRLLRVAATIGRSFSVPLLDAVGFAQTDAMLDALEEAINARFIEPRPSEREPSYRFVHELVRQTLAGSLSAPRRQHVHASIANALERLFGANLEPQASALAHHYYHAGPALDLNKTVTYLLMAARAATARAAHEDALLHIDRALAIVQREESKDIADLISSRASILRSQSRLPEAIEEYERAIELFTAAGRMAEASEAGQSLGHIHLWRADPIRACAVLRSAVQNAGMRAGVPRCRLEYLNALSLGMKGEMNAAFVTLTSARQMQAALPDISSNDIGYAHMCEAHLRYFAAQAQAAAKSGRAAVSEFRATGNLWAEVETYEAVSDSMWLTGAGTTDETVRSLSELLRRAELVGHVNAAWVYRFMSAEVLMHRGELERAEAAAREAHDFAASTKISWSFLDHVLLAAIAHYLGKFDEAAQWARSGLKVEPQSYMSGQLSGCLFWVLASKGDPEAQEALAAARPYLPIEGRTLTIGSCSCLAFVIEGLRLSGRAEEAAALEGHAEQVVANGPFWLYTRHLFRTTAGIAAACARNWTRAEEHHKAAVHIADSTECRIAQPSARYWYADMFCSRGAPGDRDRARALLGEAVCLYQDMGMEWYARSAVNKLSSV